MRIEFRLEGLMTKVDSISYTHAESHDQILSALGNNHVAIDDLGRRLGTQLQTIGDTLSESMERTLQQYQRPMINSQGPCGNPPGTEESTVIVMSSRPVRPQSTSCQTNWCTFVYHRSEKISNLNAMSSLFGRLHFKFSDIPIFTPPCNVDRCRKRRRLPYLRIDYFFPTWLLRRILTATLVYSTRGSIDIYRLRAPRVVATEAPIFTMAQTGNVEGIRSLFTENRALPFDVDCLGFSALWFVLDTPTPRMIELCKLMLSEGADPHEHVAERFRYQTCS